MMRRKITSMPTGLVIMALALIALVALVALFLFSEPSNDVDMRNSSDISRGVAASAMHWSSRDDSARAFD